MCSEKMISERDAVKREQIAFRWGWNDATADLSLNHIRQQQRELRMRERFPLSKVERPRVLEDPNDRTRWRFVNGAYETFNSISEDWSPCDVGLTYWLPTKARVEMWASLLTSPTELVEDPGE